MATNCGWDHNYIAENFTLPQIERYVQLIHEQQGIKHQLETLCIFNATAQAFGSFKDKKAFNKFMESLNLKKIQQQEISDDALQHLSSIKGFKVEVKQ